MPGTPFRKQNTRAGKLTPAQVQTIRALYASGTTQSQLARDYGMGVGQIGRICRGEAWQNIADPLVSQDSMQASVERLLQTQEDVKAVERLEEAVARQKDEQTPGRTAADRMIEELDAEAAERLKQLKGEG